MTKSELIERISMRQTQLSTKDVELAVKCVIDQMVNGLSSGKGLKFVVLVVLVFIIALLEQVEILRLGSKYNLLVNMCHILNRKGIAR